MKGVGGEVHAVAWAQAKRAGHRGQALGIGPVREARLQGLGMLSRIVEPPNRELLGARNLKQDVVVAVDVGGHDRPRRPDEHVRGQ